MPSSDCKQSLHPHLLTPAPMVRSLDGSASWLPDGSLVFSFCLFGDIARLMIPADAPQGRCDGLWEHTCFEAFIAVAGDPAYREFNFSPSGQWAAYDFSAYRQLENKAFIVQAPTIETQQTEGRLELKATLEPDALKKSSGQTSLHIGLSAVIEGSDTIDSSHSYWALHHPCERPDFHHRHGFRLQLPAWNNLR